jgi:replicative DNA helicase
MVYERLLDLYNRQAPIDVSVVAEELKTARLLDQVGGYAFLTQVSSRIPTTAQASYFIEKVREQALLREIIRSATGAVEDCYNFTGGIDEFVDQVETKIFTVTQNRVSESAKQMREPTLEAMNVINKMLMKKGELTGVPSGYKDLDALMWGFQRQEMIILAARPSMGKTSLALNFAEHAAMPMRAGTPGVGVLVFSLEMSASQLALRMLCSRARVNMKLLRALDHATPGEGAADPCADSAGLHHC